MSQTTKIDAAWHSIAGKKPNNEDSAVVHIPTAGSHLLKSKGICLLIADGVSTAEAGEQASYTATSRFINEYYKTPDTWSVNHSGEKILSTLNLHLFRNSHEFNHHNKGLLCTFSGIIIKGQVAHFFHAGDSRIYLLRQGELKQITRDHVFTLANGHRFLSRALGIDNKLNIDYGKILLQPNDILLLSTDGIHDFIPTKDIIHLLLKPLSADHIAQQLIESALSHQSNDNISCIIAKIKQLAEESLDDYNTKLIRLPFPPPLQEGMKLDGYRIKKELFASSRSQLYLVQDEEAKEGEKNHFVMKTPSINYEDDTHYIDRFIQEEWVGSRIDSPHVVKIIHQQRPRTALYYLMDYVQGITLSDWMIQNRLPKPKQAINFVKQIAKGLEAFHKNEAIHQDLKPGNIIITNNQHVTIVDFGSVFVAGLAEFYSPLQHENALGTATYSDPQYLQGSNAGIQGDLYSLATITYEIFCGHLPYGEKIENCRTAFDYHQLRYQPAAQYNPIIPPWFDRALEKGTKIDSQERYRTIEAFMQDLTHPNPEFLKQEPKTEKVANHLLFWKLLNGFWIILLILVIYLFSNIH